MAKDLFHEAVRNALIKDGWTITDDPYEIRLLDVESDIDLGAERIIAAEREGQKEKIAVEIKSFIGASFMKDLHLAVGQFSNYCRKLNLRLMVFDQVNETIVTWER